MGLFTVEESDQFLKDVEEAAVWILLSNLEQSESLAERKVDEFKADINSLKVRLQSFPESGEADELEGMHKFPLYDGRYSAKWIVNRIDRKVILITLTDSRYPRKLREFRLEGVFED